MRNTITTSISLLAGLLLLAGCGGQSDTGDQNDDTASSTSTSTSSASDVKLPERTAPAKSLELNAPCSIVTEKQARKIGIDRAPYARTSNDQQGCSYQKGEAGSDSGWRVFVAPDFKRTIPEAIKTHPGGNTREIAGYPAYATEISGISCFIVADVAEDGFLLVNGQVRPSPNKPEPCPLFTKFAKSAIENLPNA